MAVDTQKLFYLLDPVFQIENLAGKPVVGGHIEVFVAGTDTKYITWQDWDGARNPFKIPLKSDGRAVILVEPQYTYDVYVFDSFNNMVCSRLNVSPAIGGDISVSGLTQVFHDETISGNGTPQEPIGVVSAGKVYEGISPIVVNNTEDKISAQHVPLGVQDPLYFVQDDEEGCIIGFSGQTVLEGVMTESALGFENDKITGYNGSAFSAGNEYEAGSYVDITDNTISVTGLQPEGDYAYNSALSSKLDVTATGQFLTGLPEDLVYTADITGLATTAQLNEKLDKSDSGNFYPMDSNPSGYLTAVDIPESAVWNATTQTVSANSAQWAGGTANPQIPVTGINGIKISESGDKVVFEVSANYATEDWVTGQGYLTAETDWTNTITAASANAYNEATAAIPTGLATTGDLQTVSGEITALIPSTAGLASEDWVTGQGYITNDAITGKQDITGMTAYATVESLTAKQDAGDYLSASDSANFLLTSDSGNFYTTANESGFITGVDLTPYQTVEGMTAYQPAGSYLTTGDSANFYTTANESGFISEVPDTYLQNTDLSTTDGKVTAISGIPLSAGGDVPEGVMVESGLEYNAVQEISGYNGSAIAQYGAEKQWLQHDDTIVHISNSAQYALGVNLSAVAQLLGVDETVLWSGDINENNLTGTLSEPVSSFNKVKILTKINRSTPDAKQWFEFDTDREYYTILGGLTDNSDTSAGGPFHGLVMVSLTGGNVKYVNGYQHMWGVTGFDHKMFASIYKVVGIGRKA